MTEARDVRAALVIVEEKIIDTKRAIKEHERRGEAVPTQLTRKIMTLKGIARTLHPKNGDDQ